MSTSYVLEKWIEQVSGIWIKNLLLYYVVIVVILISSLHPSFGPLA